MNPTVENLVSNANKIAAQASHQNPKRKRYPKELKSIVHSLVNKHKLSVHQIIKSIPISPTSAHIWSGKQHKNKISFKKIRVRQENKSKILLQIRNSIIALIVMQCLGIALTLSLR